MARTSDAAWKRIVRLLKLARGARGVRTVPPRWQGLEMLEGRVLMSVTAEITGPPAGLEGSLLEFTAAEQAPSTGAPWTVTTASSDVALTKRFLRMDGENMVWAAGTSGIDDVFLKLGGGADVNLTPGIAAGATEPVIWDRYVAFSTSSNLWLYDIVTAAAPVAIAGGVNITNLDIDAGRIVWDQAQGGGTAVYMYDIASSSAPQQVSLPSLAAASHPDISGDKIAYRGHNGSFISDIFLYDAASPATTLISNLSGDGNAFAPRHHNGRVVWAGFDGVTTDIFYYDGATTQQLTDDAAGDDTPVVSDSGVAWITDTKHLRFLDTTTTESSPIVVQSGNFLQDLRIEGNELVWSRQASVGALNHVYYYAAGVSASPELVDSASPGGDKQPVISGGDVAWIRNGTRIIHAERSGGEATYAWSVMRDGVPYSLPAGVVTDAATFSFTPDDNGDYLVTLSVSDGVSSAATGHAVAVGNVAPIVTALSGPAEGVRGQTLSYTAAFSDAGAADTHMLTWQVLDASSNIVASGSGAAFDFIASVAGVYSVSFTVADDDGASDAESVGLTVSVAALVADLLNPGQSTLLVGGSDGADRLRVRTGSGGFEVLDNDVLVGVFSLAPGDSVQVFGGAGNDWIRVDSPATIRAEIHGGAGDDWLRGGAGNDIITGGEGDDLAFGDIGRDLLIGGSGADHLLGNHDDDILIGGDYVHAANRAAMLAVLHEWTLDLAYETRIANLSSAGVMGIYRLDASTLLNDGVRDLLHGQQGLDWFISNDDDVTDQKSYETLTEAQYLFITEL